MQNKSCAKKQKCAREQKMCRNKKCAGNKKFAWEQQKNQNEVFKGPMGAKCYFLWHIMELNCFVWPCIIFCGLVWSYVATYGFVICK